VSEAYTLANDYCLDIQTFKHVRYVERNALRAHLVDKGKTGAGVVYGEEFMGIENRCRAIAPALGLKYTLQPRGRPRKPLALTSALT
jgi:hypothetical protein